MSADPVIPYLPFPSVPLDDLGIPRGRDKPTSRTINSRCQADHTESTSNNRKGIDSNNGRIKNCNSISRKSEHTTLKSGRSVSILPACAGDVQIKPVVRRNNPQPRSVIQCHPNQQASVRFSSPAPSACHMFSYSRSGFSAAKTGA